jgi:hypothetical protein
MKQVSPEYKSEVLLLQSICSVLGTESDENGGQTSVLIVANFDSSMQMHFICLPATLCSQSQLTL